MSRPAYEPGKTMKTDIKGCSTCPPGREQWDEFYSTIAKTVLCQYEYRAYSGELFTCVATDLESARIRRDRWLHQLQHEATEWYERNVLIQGKATTKDVT